MIAGVMVTLAACLSSQVVDLGHDVDASAAPGSSQQDDAGAPIGVTPLLSVVITGTAASVCAGDCLELYAMASGGTAPYSYSWANGLGEGAGARMLCPTANVTVGVSATSAGSEIAATSSTTITVVDCSDGGAGPPPPPPPGSDGGSQPPPSTGSLCLPNPSLEGMTAIGTAGPPGVPATAAPPSWQVCQGTPDIDPGVSLLQPANGLTYVGLAVGVLAPANTDTTEAIGASLCAPLEAGVTYAFCMDLGIGVRGLPNAPGAAPPSLEIWGGQSVCAEQDLLWTSPPIANSDSWAKVCGTFTAPHSDTAVAIVPRAGTPAIGTMNWSYVIVDDITTGP
jgi:hypothetical protein